MIIVEVLVEEVSYRFSSCQVSGPKALRCFGFAHRSDRGKGGRDRGPLLVESRVKTREVKLIDRRSEVVKWSS